MNFLQRLSVVIVAVSSVGCASLGTPENARTQDVRSFSRPVWTTDGMYLVTGRSGALFLTSSPLDLDHYRGVVLGEIQISTKDRSRDLTPYEEERLKGYFTRQLTKVFERNGWPVVDTPGEDVLTVRLAVRDLELRRSQRSHFGSVVSRVSTEKISIALELRDAVKSERKLLFGDFSIDIRRRLRQVQRGDFPPPPRPS